MGMSENQLRLGFLGRANITEWGKGSLSPDVFCFCVSGLYGEHLPTSGGGLFLRFAALRVPECHHERSM